MSNQQKMNDLLAKFLETDQISASDMVDWLVGFSALANGFIFQ